MTNHQGPDRWLALPPTRWIERGALCLAVATVVLLGLEVRELRRLEAEVEVLKTMRVQPYPGQWIPTVRVPTLGGDSVTLGLVDGDRSQVLIFFTASCPYCRETVRAWREITASLAADEGGRAHDVVWVSLSSRDSTIQFAQEHAIAAPVALLEDEKTVRVFRVKGVPLTLVLDAGGQVAFSRASIIREAVAVDSVLAAARNVRSVQLEAEREHWRAAHAER